MRRLLADLGDPQAAWPAAVHVAGTKGKGSTVAMLAAILRAAGYKAGAYSRCGGSRGYLHAAAAIIRDVQAMCNWHAQRPVCCAQAAASSAMPFLSPCSPHITALNERISVGGTPISDAAFDALVARHGPAIEAAAEREAAAGQALSHFEIVTALAFKHFQEQQVGVGGLELVALPTAGCPSCMPPVQLKHAGCAVLRTCHATYKPTHTRSCSAGGRSGDRGWAGRRA